MCRICLGVIEVVSVLIEVPLSCYDESCKHWPTFNSAPNERLAENYKTVTAFFLLCIGDYWCAGITTGFKTDVHQTIKKIVLLSGNIAVRGGNVHGLLIKSVIYNRQQEHNKIFLG